MSSVVKRVGKRAGTMEMQSVVSTVAWMAVMMDDYLGLTMVVQTVALKADQRVGHLVVQTVAV